MKILWYYIITEGRKKMKVIMKKAYKESCVHYIEVYYIKAGDYMLTVDGAFYSKHETKEDAMKEVNRIIEWFGWVS